MHALDQVRPTIVLVESPAETTAAFKWVGAGLQPPVALLGYVVDQPHRAVFAPLATFSPEWQAISWANRNVVPVEAIDLPLAISLATHPRDDAELVLGGAPVDPIGALAAAAGEPDAERWWEDVIEHRGNEYRENGQENGQENGWRATDSRGVDAFAAVAEAMAAVRAGTVPSLSESRREAHMRRCIRAAVKAGHVRVAVVCGAWHVPALDVGRFPAAADAATLRGLVKVKVAVSWVPWTHARLASASGYGAGVQSPGWYDHVFQYSGADGVARFFVRAAHVLRAADMQASPDHLIAATRMADALATMRGRPQPGLSEVLDAAETVMGGLAMVRRRLVVGDAIGSVPDGAPQVPLARDLAIRQRAMRLKPAAGEQLVEVDLRNANGLRRSHLLHQLNAIGVPWGTLEEGRGSSGTFRETWRLNWSPEWSVRIVEFAGYGTTVEVAATNRLVERAGHASGIVEVAAALDLALLASVPEAVAPIVRVLSDRAATDPDIAELMSALGPLAHAQRYGDVRSTDRSSVAAVFDGIVVRVLAGLVNACASLDDDAAAAMVERISETQQAFALIDHPSRRRAFPEVLEQLAEGGGHGLVQGRAARVLHDTGRWAALLVEKRLGRALSGGTPPAVGAAFVEGFVAGSGTVLMHDADLLAVVDRWLSSLPPQAFEQVIPLLRRTFGGFEAAERRQIGRLVAGEHREVPALVGDDFDVDRLLAATATVRHIYGLAPT